MKQELAFKITSCNIFILDTKIVWKKRCGNVHLQLFKRFILLFAIDI